MKKIIFLLATVAIFSACNSSKPDAKTELSLADQLLDEQLYAEAIGAQNAEKCTKIAAKDLQKECENVVDALKITEKALTDSDKKICGQIELERYQENCEAQVEEAQANVEKQKTLAKELEKNDAIDTKALSEDNEKLCEEIQDENQKNSCYYNVLTNRALTDKDSEICLKIPSKELQTNCQNTVKGLN